MTEDEAKTKWCPFTRLTDGGREYFDNRGDKFGGTSGKDGTDASRCIGSGCMAWRAAVETAETEDDQTPEGGSWIKYGPAIRTLSDSPPWQRWTRVGGHCGLAGKP